MIQLKGAADLELLSELKDVSLLSPDVIEKIDCLMKGAESTTLNEFLLAGASVIPEAAWLSWLIRNHSCHRFGPVTWNESAAPWAAGAHPEESNLAYRATSEGRPMIAVLRPDQTAILLARHPVQKPLWAAATLHEIKLLHAEVGQRA